LWDVDFDPGALNGMGNYPSRVLRWVVTVLARNAGKAALRKLRIAMGRRGETVQAPHQGHAASEFGPGQTEGIAK